MLINKMKPYNIVIINSHASNRGDNAAQQSMINSLLQLTPKAKVTVITNAPAGLQLPEDIEILKAFSLFKKAMPLVLIGIILRLAGLKSSLLSRKFGFYRVATRLVEADLIISAPGGPYFGDIYKTHEISKHLFKIFLAKLLGKPVMIYGPSMGPFTGKLRNILRRYVLNKVEIITLRDPGSKEYLKELKLTKPLIFVTADSAFQETINVDKAYLEKVMSSEKISITGRPLIAITPTGARWNYPNSETPQEDQNNYNHLIAKTADHLIETLGATIIFIPQLFGKSSDVPLIDSIRELIKAKEHVRILSDKWNSIIQQAIISHMDLVIGNRYHSAVFGLKMHVPTICIAYEHKAVGVMTSAHMEKFIIDIKNFTYEELIKKIDSAWLDRENIRQQLKENMVEVKTNALKNSLIAKALVNCIFAKDLTQDTIKAEVDRLISSN